MAKKRRKKKKIPNKNNEEESVNIDYIMWLFVGFFIWFSLVNSAHTLHMNNKAATFFFSVTILATIATFILVKPIIKKDIDFCKRYERWNLLAYFAPLPLFIVGISLVIVLPIVKMVLPYGVHQMFGHNTQIHFKVIQKRRYTACPDEGDCYKVKDICLKNKQYQKDLLCLRFFSTEDWTSIKRGEEVIIKGKESFLGIEPKSYTLLRK